MDAVFAGFCSCTAGGTEKAVRNIPGSLIANPRYPIPTARRLFRANVCGSRPGRHFCISSSMAAATRDRHADRTASSSSAWLAKCLYAALGETPACRVASRRMTALGPPARASWSPAVMSALRRSPWRKVLRFSRETFFFIVCSKKSVPRKAPLVDSIHFAVIAYVNSVYFMAMHR